ELAGGLLDRALDVVLRAAEGLGLVDRVAEAEVHRRVGPADAGGDVDGAAELAEELAPLGVDGVLAGRHVGGVGMSCHSGSGSGSGVLRRRGEPAGEGGRAGRRAGLAARAAAGLRFGWGWGSGPV